MPNQPLAIPSIFGDGDLRPRARFSTSLSLPPLVDQLVSIQLLPRILCRRADPESQILDDKIERNGIKSYKII